MAERKTNLCPKFEQGINILGKKWNGQIIESLRLEPMRFCSLRNNIAGISDRVLTERLKGLQAVDIVTREEVEENEHTYTRYCLTKKGSDLQPVLESLHHWADEWVCNEEIAQAN
ncbi:MAG: helix-turn-helix domain-containing protein [Aerococcus sp.]|nr:helix-turn-helix domain-containing protein [Aerococcus sp.]